MSSEKTNNSQEIDLSLVYRKISSFFAGVELSIYRLIRFVIKNIFIILGLVIIGVVAGYFLDNQKNKIYKHEIIVIPNVDSASYLYSYIENVEFTKNSPIINVDIEPIINVGELFLKERDMAKFLMDNNVEITKHKKGNETERIYKYHLITIITNKKDTDGSIISLFLKKINNQEYFTHRLKIYQEIIDKRIEENQKSIDNINDFFKKIGSQSDIKTSGFNVEVNSQAGDLMNTKNYLVTLINTLHTSKLEQTEVLYEVSRFSNLKVKSFPYTMTMPLILITLFIVCRQSVKLYRFYESKYGK